MSNVNTLQSSWARQYIDISWWTSDLPVHTILYNNSICCKKKLSDIRNKIYYIFGEYKVQDSKLTPLYHVGGIIADIKVCKLYV